MAPGLLRSLGGLAMKKSKKKASKQAASASAPLFGSALRDAGEARVVAFVEGCCEALRGEPAATFRLSPPVSDVDRAQTRLEAPGRVSGRIREPPLVLAALLKRWLSALPTPLLPPSGVRDAALGPAQVLSELAPLERQLAAIVVRLLQSCPAGDGDPNEPPADLEALAELLAPALLHSGRPGAADTSGGNASRALKVSMAADRDFLLAVLRLDPDMSVLDPAYIGSLA